MKRGRPSPLFILEMIQSLYSEGTCTINLEINPGTESMLSIQDTRLYKEWVMTLHIEYAGRGAGLAH